MPLTRRAFVLAVSSLCSCMGIPDSSEESLSSQVSQALTMENGGNLNGGNLNGGNLNGNDLSGFLVSIRYLPASKAGVALERVWLEGATLRGEQGGVALSAEQMMGVELVGNLGSGATVPVRVAGMVAAPAPNADLRLYQVEFRASDGLWYPACRNASGSPVLALPVESVWDYRQGVVGGGSKSVDIHNFTFACLGGAIAKCALWGYRPWATHQGIPLAPYHQACTRLVRADYCGTGQSYTTEGTLINLYDRLGIQQDTENWLFEASWGERGALCISVHNRAHELIPCYNSLASVACGLDLFPTPGLLRNETPLEL